MDDARVTAERVKGGGASVSGHAREIVHGCSKWAAITTAAVAPVLALTGGVPGWLVVYGVASAAAWAATRRRRRG